jgi:hypothetical protein
MYTQSNNSTHILLCMYSYLENPMACGECVGQRAFFFNYPLQIAQCCLCRACLSSYCLQVDLRLFFPPPPFRQTTPHTRCLWYLAIHTSLHFASTWNCFFYTCHACTALKGPRNTYRQTDRQTS